MPKGFRYPHNSTSIQNNTTTKSIPSQSKTKEDILTYIYLLTPLIVAVGVRVALCLIRGERGEIGLDIMLVVVRMII